MTQNDATSRVHLQQDAGETNDNTTIINCRLCCCRCGDHHQIWHVFKTFPTWATFVSLSSLESNERCQCIRFSERSRLHGCHAPCFIQPLPYSICASGSASSGHFIRRPTGILITFFLGPSNRISRENCLCLFLSSRNTSTQIRYLYIFFILLGLMLSEFLFLCFLLNLLGHFYI